MKIVIYTESDSAYEEKVLRWWKNNCDRQCYEISCPPNTSCEECPFHSKKADHVTVVKGGVPTPTSADSSSIRDKLREYCMKIDSCDKCMFMSKRGCDFNYNCPADLEKRKWSDKHDDMSVSEDN